MPGLLLACFSWPTMGMAQTTDAAHVCVTDVAGLPVVSAKVEESDERTLLTGGRLLGVTGGDGCLAVPVRSNPPDGATRVAAKEEGYTEASTAYPAAGGTARLVLRPLAVQQSVTVTANRGLPGTETADPSVLGLSQAQLSSMPGLAFDDRLRQVAGFVLFRRTSSWTANPTSQGVSLRGLGSTAASRTLVVSDQAPLNDPFGGWVHWNEIPSLALRQVQLLRGGSSDLY